MAKIKQNASRVAQAYEALGRARRLMVEAELEISNARSAVDDMKDENGSVSWMGQFESGVLYQLSEGVRDLNRRVFRERKRIWEDM